MIAAAHPARIALAGVRAAIDAVDDGVVLLFAARRGLVRAAATLKRGARMPLRDPVRERAVAQRAASLARRLDLPADTARDLAGLLIGDACRQQGVAPDLDQGTPDAGARMLVPMILPATAPRLLRLLPPPRRFAPVLRRVPAAWPARLLEAAFARVFEACARDGSLDFMDGRRLGIEVEDLGLAWVVGRRDGVMRVLDAPAEASVRGSATDLLLLAGRLEDADTLFFQRRLALTGDTELGLTARNLLERLPWEQVPLALRIALNRAARFARAARAAHRGDAAGV